MKILCMRGGDGMPRMSKKAKLEWDFFLNPNTGRKNYNPLCRRCLRDCKANITSCWKQEKAIHLLV